MNCNEAVSALVASMESGTATTDLQREHIRTCARCRSLIDSAKEFQSLLTGNGIEVPPIDPTLSAAEEELRRARGRRTVRIVIGAAIVLAVAAVLHVISVQGGLSMKQGLIFFAAGAVMVTMAGVCAWLIVSIVRGANQGNKRRLYKRLKPGRAISGVCMGLAETFGINAGLVRLVFFLLLFVDGLGFWVYVILDLAMPVHPDDREYLLRFRLRRWWQRRMSHAEHNAG